MDFKKVGLSDRPFFDRLFAVYQPRISEYTFVNLYVWGLDRELEYAVVDGGAVMKLRRPEGVTILAPIGFEDCDRIYALICDYALKNGVIGVKLINEFQKKFAKKTGFPVHEDRDNFDYVYKTHSLASLKGWRLDGKRGFVKKFTGNYTFRYVEYDNSYKGACLEFLDRWMATRVEGNPSIAEEGRAIRGFLDNCGQWDTRGGLLFVGDRLVAFSFGEKLNDSTFVVHFEKADLSYTGSYQAINQLFIQREAEGRYAFVNREQDLGIPGIRKAKLSYAPLRLVKKYIMRFDKA